MLQLRSMQTAHLPTTMVALSRPFVLRPPYLNLILTARLHTMLLPRYQPTLLPQLPMTDTARHTQTDPINVQYRQLVSRAATQRLHSPSLDRIPSAQHNVFETWEMQERQQAREKARMHAQSLGVSWSMPPSYSLEYFWH
jgi:hypothetical protein